MEDEILVKVDGVSKKFCRSLKRSLLYGLKDISSELFGIRKNGQLRKGEFWAVNDVSFELRRGECLGLIGHNGAGKSTLLKMLNGLIKPDKGKINMKGRIGALIELGAGFNPILTGRENIYNNGAVLGFSKKEIDAKFDDIVEFAEIDEFIDTPVQNYSSGMKVRLGFAVAAQMEPDVLIIDEVLAVGDMGFKLKCFNIIDDLLKKSAIIFVTHTMPQVSRICSSAMLLNKGEIKICSDDISKVVEQYFANFNIKSKDFIKNDKIELLDFRVLTNKFVEEIPIINYLDDLLISMEIKVNKLYRNSVITLSIYDKELRPIGLCFDRRSLGEKLPDRIVNDYLYYTINLRIPRINLSSGIYLFSIAASESFRSKPIMRMDSFSKLQVVSENIIWPPIEFESIWK